MPGLFFAVALVAAMFGIAEAEQMRVGVITPLSGNMANIGTALKNGLELARAKSPEAFKDINFIFEDGQYLPEPTLSAYRKLRDVNKIQLLLVFGDFPSFALAPETEKSKLPFLSFDFGPSAAPGKKYLIRTLNVANEYQDAMLDELRWRKLSKFITVNSDVNFLTSMANLIKAGAKNPETWTSLGNFPPDVVDFRPVITKLASDMPVGVYLLPHQLISFFKQAKEQNRKFPAYGTDLFESAAKSTDVPDLFEGSIFPDNDPSEDFRREYRTKFGNDSQLTFACNAFVVANLIGEKFGKGGAAKSSDEILEALQEVNLVETEMGPMTYVSSDEFGQYYSFPIVVKEMRSGTGVPVPRR